MAINIPEAITEARQAEAALLGSILIYPEVIKEVRAIVNPEDFLDARFYDALHTRIYKAMLACETPNQIAVAHEMKKQGTLRKGDCAYLVKLTAEVPDSPLDYMLYAKVVADNALWRRTQYHIRKGNYDRASQLIDRHRQKLTRQSRGVEV